MAIPKIAVYIRKNGNFYAAPKTPDFGAVYYLRFYESGKERKQKVGHVDLLPKAKLLLERRLFAKANGFVLPEAERLAEAAERKTLAQAIDQYAAFQRTRRIKGVLRSAKDVEGIHNSLVKFQKSCGKQFFDDVDEKDLHRFIDQLERRANTESPITVRIAEQFMEVVGEKTEMYGIRIFPVGSVSLQSHLCSHVGLVPTNAHLVKLGRHAESVSSSLKP